MNFRLNLILSICVFSIALNACQTTGEIAQTGPTFKSQKFLVETVISKPLSSDIRGEIKFPSIPVISLKQFLRGEYRGFKSEISGFLSFPVQTEERKLPAIVIMHGQGGISFYERNWERFFNGLGFATFVVDSNTGRSCTQYIGGCAAQHQGMANIVDAYQALNLIRSHPKIDKDKIILFGLSIGGKVALYSGMQRFQRLWGRNNQKFIGYIALYPPCNIAFEDDHLMDGSPVRIYIGEKDEWASASTCAAYADRLRTDEKNVKVTIYKNAHHGFDTMGPEGPGGFDVSAWLHANCVFKEDRNLGDVPQQVVQVLPLGVGKKPTLQRIAFLMYSEGCTTSSGRLEYDASASAEAFREIREFLMTLNGS